MLFYHLFGKTTYFCTRNDKDKPISASDSDTSHFSLITYYFIRSGRANDCRAGARRDGLPFVCADGKGRKGAPRGR